MEQSRKTGKPVQFEFWQWQQMFSEVVEQPWLIPLGKKPDNVSQAGSFAMCIQSFQFEVDNCLSGTPGKVSGTIVLLFSRIKNVLIYRWNIGNGIKFIWKVNSILTLLCATVMSIKIFVDGGTAEFEIVVVVGHSYLKVENVMEIWIVWEWVYISWICSNWAITDIFEMQRFIH